VKETDFEGQSEQRESAGGRISAAADAPGSAERHEGPPEAHDLGRTTDPVDLALATAIERASAAGEWTAVEVLARQLDAHRKARSGVVSLDAERARRDGKR
jgi:hypothetical protein